jgi:hypothetical protein
MELHAKILSESKEPSGIMRERRVNDSWGVGMYPNGERICVLFY